MMVPGRKLPAEMVLDRDGLAELFDAHFPVIHRYLRRRLDAESAKELAAETFLVAFRRRSDFDPSRGDPLPWLYGIAGNLMRRERRREERQLRAYARTGVDPLAADLDGLEIRLDARATGRRLARALASLSSGNREVLLLFAWAELSYEEISEALRIPVGTVRSRLARARSGIRRALEEEDLEGRTSITEGGSNA